MKNNWRLSLIVLLFFFSCGKDEVTVSEDFTITISKTLFSQDEIKLYDFVVDENANIILAYNGIEENDFLDDQIIDSTFIHLQKIDRLGQSVWTKQYHTSVPSKVFDIIQTSDGGFLLLGTTQAADNSHCIYLIKTDQDGNQIWEKELPIGANVKVYEMAEKANGNVLVIGKMPFDELIEIDPEGQLVQRTLLPSFLLSFPHGNGLCIDENETVVACGRGMAAYSSGELIWDFEYERDNVDYTLGLLSISPVDAQNGGGYLGIGFRVNNLETPSYNHIDYLLTRVDANGIVLWEKTFDNDDQDWGYDINPTSDGHFVAVGKTVLTGGEGGYVRAYKFDADGNILWQHKIEREPSNHFVDASTIKQVDEDHVAILYVEMDLRDPQIITEIKITKLRLE